MLLKKQICLLMLLSTVLLFSSQVLAGGNSYSVTEIRQHANALAGKLNIARDKKYDLMLNLDRALANEWFRNQMRYRKVKGIFVYEAAKGGLIFNYMEGDGLISFLGNVQGAPIYLKSWSVGAQIGGGGIWGVGLAIDLNRISHFGGEYHGKSQQALAGDAATYNWVVMRNSNDTHEIFLLQAGRGFAAGVAHERLTISRGW